ncbi:MAG: ECF-type sigma factor [Candidatus Eisenbacteria bacterium]
MNPEPGDITEMLARSRQGDPAALDQVFARVHAEVHRIAHLQLLRVKGGNTLTTTAVVNEAYLKLARAPELAVEDREHFFAIAALAMRQILLNHARSRRAQKRGGGVSPVWRTEDGTVESKIDQVIELDAALERLREKDERMARIVDLRYFAGLTVEETATLLGLADRTVRRDWRVARAFLYRELMSATSPE